ncbi:MAG: Hsp33 family molecular chaperone HslO [Alphaproteobacteria bacterium]
MTKHNNFILPFMIDNSALSGRMIRLDNVLNNILSRHNYPEPVNKLLGQFITVTCSLANAFKYDGIFTLEARGDGAVPFIVCDISSDGSVRGYAKVDGDIANDINDDKLLKSLMGKGNIMFSLDQVATKERYQGIVELNHDTLQDSIEEYFKQSVQLVSKFRIACEKTKSGWVAGVISIQQLPKEATKHDVEAEAENWERASILLESTKDSELVDVSLSGEDLLFRLYHEDGVRVYEEQELIDKCRCSKERMLKAVLSVPEDERKTLITENNTIDVKCEYCSTTHKFNEAEAQLNANNN